MKKIKLKISVIELGLSVGVSWSIAIFIFGLLTILFSTETTHWTNIILLKSFINLIYPGWGISFAETLLMTIWAFVHGFLQDYQLLFFIMFFHTKSDFQHYHLYQHYIKNEISKDQKKVWAIY